MTEGTTQPPLHVRVLILGGDGYLGWPQAMYLSARGELGPELIRSMLRAISRFADRVDHSKLQMGTRWALRPRLRVAGR